jgi:hypothetical protein
MLMRVILLAIAAVSTVAFVPTQNAASPQLRASSPSRREGYEHSRVVRRVFDVADQEGPKRASKATLERIDKLVNAARCVQNTG